MVICYYVYFNFNRKELMVIMFIMIEVESLIIKVMVIGVICLELLFCWVFVLNSKYNNLDVFIGYLIYVVYLKGKNINWIFIKWVIWNFYFIINLN